MKGTALIGSSSVPFVITVVFREFYKLRLNAYIYKLLLAAIAGVNDHIGLAGPTFFTDDSWKAVGKLG